MDRLAPVRSHVPAVVLDREHLSAPGRGQKAVGFHEQWLAIARDRRPAR
jgi:hypothetical protein